MTNDGPFGERRANPTPGAAPQLLDVCDRLLGERGRRRHLFGWLRTPDAEQWLPVDAYYPGNRLVVLCRDRADDGDGDGDDGDDGDRLIAARVPEHGLRLLRL